MWTAANSPYKVTGMVTVPSGATLTIEPGVVVKFKDTSSGLTVASGGKLIADGEGGNEIVFTSVNDDLHGGDTNGSGPAAARGDWSYIYFDTASEGNIFSHCLVQYGGYSAGGYYGYWNNSLLTFYNTALDLSHVTLAHSDGYGVYVWGSTSRVKLLDSAVTDCRYYGVYGTRGLELGLSGSSISLCSYGLVVSDTGSLVVENSRRKMMYYDPQRWMYGKSFRPFKRAGSKRPVPAREA